MRAVVRAKVMVNNVANFMKFFSGDYATASARPTLIIEYYVP